MAKTPGKELENVRVIHPDIASRLAAAQSMMVADSNGDEMFLAILNAATVEDVLNDSTAIGIKDIIGKPFTIESAQLRESDIETSSLPCFAVMHVTFDDGAKAVVTTGATTVVAQLIRMQELNAFPQRVSSKESITNNGYTAVSLIAAPEQVQMF